MPEDLGEKSEMPTSKKRQDARERGQVAKSKDLSSAVMLLCGLLIFRFLGEYMFEEMGLLVEVQLGANATGNQLTVDGVTGQLSHVLGSMARIVVAPMALIFLAAVVSGFVQVGPLLSTQAIQPKLSRLNPINGIKNIYGKRGVAKSVTDVGKFAAVAVVVIVVVHSNLRELVLLPQLDAPQAFLQVVLRLYDLALKIVAVLLLLGFFEFAYQRWQQTQDLKMTKSEVKEERKAAEGDPKIKQRRVQVAQQIYLQRLGIDVPQADVVVTNPTHFAVALKYEPEEMQAPKVVAKGADLMAMRIRQIAAGSSVPIVERPPLARALYRQVEVGQEIPPLHYEAVAELLAYVYRLEERAAG